GGSGSNGAVAFSTAQVGDKYVTETPLPAGWAITNIACTANGATVLIGTGQGAGFSQGTGSGYDAGDDTVKVTIGAGNTPSCTFTNTKQASLTINKTAVGGDGTFPYTTSGSGLSGFSITTSGGSGSHGAVAF